MSNPAPAEPPDEASYVPLDGDGREPSLRGRARPLARIAFVVLLAGAVVVVLLAGVAITVARPGRGKTGPPGVTPAPDITPEAPWDGKQSRRLPVTVTPASGIVDGQTVTITGSGFPVGKSVAAVVCTIAAGSQGVAACDVSTSSFMAGTTTIVDRDGRFTIRYPMHRRILVGGQTVDCATGNVDPDAYHQAVLQFGPMVRITTPGAFSCLVAVGAIDDYDQSGGALVAFAGETFVPFEVDGVPEPTTTTAAPTTTSAPTSLAPPTSPPTGAPTTSTPVPTTATSATTAPATSTIPTTTSRPGHP
jgi:cell division septation protein DedD